MGEAARRQRSPRAPEPDQLRLLARVARMYHERGLRQPQIAQQLNISQPRVSRLLKQATENGLVRTVVVLPPGTFVDVEEELQGRYGLNDAVVVDTAADTTEDVVPALGAAAASYLDVTLTGGDVIGISSWSATLLAAVEVMRPKHTAVAEEVVQVVGGLGNPQVQSQATRLTGRLAQLTGADPVYMPTPGVVSTPAVREALATDAAVGEVMRRWDRLTLVLAGIGSLAPSPLLRQSGNAIAEEEQADLREQGAVGDVCLRFFDGDGELVRSSFDTRVVGISPAQLREAPRRIGVAGGSDKLEAIRAALLGRWVNTLVTDLDTATSLIEAPG